MIIKKIQNQIILEENTSPSDFISLIKYSRAVFTDSFHASVFSHIYNKNFYVFDRAEFSSMKTRIDSLLSVFGTQDRFVSQEEKALKNEEDFAKIDFNKYILEKERSLNFLNEFICKVKNKNEN